MIHMYLGDGEVSENFFEDPEFAHRFLTTTSVLNIAIRKQLLRKCSRDGFQKCVAAVSDVALCYLLHLIMLVLVCLMFDIMQNPHTSTLLQSLW